MAQVFMSALDDNDFVVRRQREERERVYPVEKFLTEAVKVAVGPRDTLCNVVLRYPEDSNRGMGVYVFASYLDNRDWHSRPERDWLDAAKKAMEKFAAQHDRYFKHGPSPEPLKPLSLMGELNTGFEHG